MVGNDFYDAKCQIVRLHIFDTLILEDMLKKYLHNMENAKGGQMIVFLIFRKLIIYY